MTYVFHLAGFVSLWVAGMTLFRGPAGALTFVALALIGAAICFAAGAIVSRLEDIEEKIDTASRAAKTSSEKGKS